MNNFIKTDSRRRTLPVRERPWRISISTQTGRHSIRSWRKILLLINCSNVRIIISRNIISFPTCRIRNLINRQIGPFPIFIRIIHLYTKYSPLRQFSFLDRSNNCMIPLIEGCFCNKSPLIYPDSFKYTLGIKDILNLYIF